VPVGIYIITAVAVDDWGAKTTSAPVTVRVVSPPASIVSNRAFSANRKVGTEETIGLEVNPNPVSNILNVSLKGLPFNKPVSLSIISTAGVVMRTVPVNNSAKVVQMDVSSLASGGYILKLLSGEKMFYKRFIKL
jgi:hypothetical protein